MRAKTLVAVGIAAAAPFAMMHSASATDVNWRVLSTCGDDHLLHFSAHVDNDFSEVLTYSLTGSSSWFGAVHTLAPHQSEAYPIGMSIYAAVDSTVTFRIKGTFPSGATPRFHPPEVVIAYHAGDCGAKPNPVVSSTTTIVPDTVVLAPPVSITAAPTSEAAPPQETVPTVAPTPPAGTPPQPAPVAARAPRPSGLPATCLVQAHCPAVANADAGFLVAVPSDGHGVDPNGVFLAGAAVAIAGCVLMVAVRRRDSTR